MMRLPESGASTGNVVGYNSRGAVSSSSVGSGSGGGNVDDILRRLGTLEASVSEVRTEVGAILAVIPHLATKADLAGVRAEVIQIKADVAGVETAIIKWIVATTLASAALAFAIAKFVH